jgi:hypothetical protein
MALQLSIQRSFLSHHEDTQKILFPKKGTLNLIKTGKEVKKVVI